MTKTQESTQPSTEIKAPRGVSGAQRELFLRLNHEQREAYRYHFDVCGRPAALCFRYATGLDDCR